MFKENAIKITSFWRIFLYNQRCQWKVITNAELHFVVSLCVRSTRAMPPKGSRTEALQGLRERNMSLPCVAETISSDLEETRFFGVKMWISAVLQKTGIPG